jgi:hypothetical protein
MLDSFCGHYSPSTPSASTNGAQDDKAKSKLFAENIESIRSYFRTLLVSLL